MAKDAAAENVIVFYTDQQRGDSLGCAGNEYARTPHIDGLAARGNLYTRHYSANPVCMPSRASVFTGRTTLAHRVLDNGIFLPETRAHHAGGLPSRRIPHRERRQAPPPDLQVLPRRRVDGEHGAMGQGRLRRLERPLLWLRRGAADARARRGRRRPLRALAAASVSQAQARRRERPVCRRCTSSSCSYKSNLPLEAHHSTWIADNAVEMLDKFAAGDEPFFLYVSFPDPHHPFTPPAPYSTMYDGVEFDAAARGAGRKRYQAQALPRCHVREPLPERRRREVVQGLPRRRI